jgi:hypothetical protein
MTLLTIFAAPKPMKDAHTAIIQANAIRSWTLLGDQVEVVLVGDEDGLAETAVRFGIHHLPAVKRNEQGTPLISSIFDLARRNSASPMLAYANADILLLADFMRAVRKMETGRREFLMVGRRWNLDVPQPLEFQAGWEETLRSNVFERGELYTHTGIDYFVFRRESFTSLPDFAVGRAGWDNWMLYHASSSGMEVIDATPSILAVHQNHDYRHLKGDKSLYQQEESLENKRLAGGQVHNYHLLDSNRELVRGRIRRPGFSLVRWLCALERLFLTNDMTSRRWWLAIKLRRMQLRLLDRERALWKSNRRYAGHLTGNAANHD